ncbi:MAG: class I adenylate-forming enzyme family protein [Polyangiales bacterium]
MTNAPPWKTVALDPDGRRRSEPILAGLPEVPPLSVVVLAVADPAFLVAGYEAVLAREAIPLLLHGTTPLALARRMVERVGAAALLHAPLEGDPHVETAPAGKARLPERGHLLCTSGTTSKSGEPKVYFFPEARAEANARAHLASLGLADARGLRILLPLPVSHAFGLVCGHLAARATGSTLLAFTSTPDPATLLEVAAREQAQVLHLTPPMVRLLARRHARRAAPALPELSLVGVGSAPSTAGEIRTLHRLFPASRIVATYGLTECGPRVATFQAGTAEHPSMLLDVDDAAQVPLGEPLAGVRLALEDTGSDGVGELVVHTPYVATGRLVDGALEPMPAGPFRTRDAARREAYGGITLLGRMDGTIVRGGTNVYPTNVEPLVEDVAGVTGVCLVGQRSPTYGEVPVLVCEVAAGTHEEELRRSIEARLADELPPTDRPVEIRFVRTLPRTSLGKVIRAEVKSRLEAPHGSW